MGSKEIKVAAFFSSFALFYSFHLFIICKEEAGLQVDSFLPLVSETDTMTCVHL